MQNLLAAASLDGAHPPGPSQPGHNLAGTSIIFRQQQTLSNQLLRCWPAWFLMAGLVQRNNKKESRSLSLGAFDPDSAAHQLDQPLADGQPQTGAAVMARDRAVSLAKRTE